ncbi:hypothetical protein CASFOL_022038 [Castilleja foliolosa]|uniref:Uncharacterized protein n=1 Tax=Castilleja foliolosa TaxID=1961234 RepID=A0ABD3D109_9LAMI
MSPVKLVLPFSPPHRPSTTAAPSAPATVLLHHTTEEPPWPRCVRWRGLGRRATENSAERLAEVDECSTFLFDEVGGDVVENGGKSKKMSGTAEEEMAAPAGRRSWWRIVIFFFYQTGILE